MLKRVLELTPSLELWLELAPDITHALELVLGAGSRPGTGSGALSSSGANA